MKKLLPVIAALVMVFLLVFGAVPVSAADPAVITITSFEPLTIDGVLTTKFPASVTAGATIKIVTNQYYLNQGERWTFTGWSDGTTATSFKPTVTGDYTANWVHEILVQVNSVVASVQQSLWLPYGVPYVLKAPLDFDGGNTRYHFLQWNNGQTPLLPENTIVPFQPMTISADYSKSYLLTIIAPDGIVILGGGWYPDNSSVVLQAPKDVYDAAKTSRKDFDTWESVGSTPIVLPNPTAPIMTITVKGPYTVQADYNQQYMVVANSPFGTLNHDWITSGEEVQLNAPATQDVIPDQERFIFQRWTGLAGLESPKVGGVVTQPLTLTAVYAHQYKVTLVAPFSGSGDGWCNAGQTATIRVPLTSQKGLFMKSTFTGYAGYSGTDTTLQVLVQAPVTITANYSTGLDIRVLGIIIGAVLLALIIWVFGRKVTFKNVFKRKSHEPKE